MKYKNFTLDQFQEDAIGSIEKGHSVIVSAATGTGKTLIADYAIDKFIKLNKRVIYTAPIKALSNQKYRDFKAEYGEDRVGIMTGDTVVNPAAQVLIMTTEVYRNMLLTDDPSIGYLSYVIFDEIHFISDIERGTVWEESIIFSPPHVRFLALSATIPNCDEFADWIRSIKKHPVDVVNYDKRAVPLGHYFFDREMGIMDRDGLKKLAELMRYPRYDSVFRGRGKQKVREKPPHHLDLVSDIAEKGWLPCIFFVFSRRACEQKAGELYRKMDFMTAHEKARIISEYNKLVDPSIKSMESVQFIRKIIVKGIGVHHAGILPNVKEIVEKLFALGLLKVLYTTETFAVGINYPAKTVCFNTLDKYDGYNFRYMHSKEYFQMAGRAGRRGIDKVGRAISMFDRGRDDVKKVLAFTERDIDPIVSRFRLSPNAVLNLVRSHKEEEIKKILKANFDYYLKKKQKKEIRIMSSYNHLFRKLSQMGCIKGHNLTDKGLFATHIYSNEILITEIFATNLWRSLSEQQINVIVGAVMYEGGRADRFKRVVSRQHITNLVNVIGKNKYAAKYMNRRNIANLYGVIARWTSGCSFEEVMDISNLQEGDYIRLFRQVIDMLRQIRHATQDMELEEKISGCLNRIDRDIVKVVF